MKNERLTGALGKAESALRTALQVYETQLLALPADQRHDSEEAHRYEACLRAATIVSFLKQDSQQDGQLRIAFLPNFRTDTLPPEG